MKKAFKVSNSEVDERFLPKMGRKNESNVVDAHRRDNIDEYVDVIGNFKLSDIRNQKKKQIKKAVAKEVQGHKQIIQEASENAVRYRQYKCSNSNL